MDPREVIAKLALEFSEDLPRRGSRQEWAALLVARFLQGLVCMQEQPARAAAIVAAVADDERARFGTCGDAEMARTLAEQYRIAGMAVRR